MATPEDLQFASLVVSQGLCTRRQVDECLSFIARLIEEGVTPVPRLGELLVRRGWLSAAADATLRHPSDGAATAPPTPELPAEAAVAAKDPAHVLGKYVRVSRLGAGGMGEVWKGWDRELRRWVALKFLHHPDPAQEARFRREAQTAAALNHPHIASVFEVGSKDGKPFIAMQYIEGPTLAAFPRTDRRALVGLVRDAALAVHHAHGQGVVHRDLKPANLMVESGRVFVMDFGLAKATSVDSSLSVSGSVVGTPAYMPPEQARGRTQGVSAESDVYSLGATLYELLTGRPPFEGSDVYDVLRKVVDQDPVPLRTLRPAIDRDLQTIVLKCLEKQPERRYRTAQELADDLGRWLEGEPILAHPPSAFYQARKFVLRRKALVAIAVAGLAAVAATVVLLVPPWLHERTLKELGPLRTQIAVVREWVRQPFRKPEEIRRALQAEIDGVSAYLARHPDLSQAHHVRAQARLYLGDLAGAEADVREALRLDPEFLPAWTLLGRVQLEAYAGLLSAEKIEPFRVREDDARKALEAAGESLRRGSGRTGIEAWGLSRTRDDDVSETLADALHLYYVKGSREEALRRLDEAHRRAPSEEFRLWAARWLPYGEEKDRRIRETLEIAPLWAPGHVERGNALAAEGRSADAIAAYTDALARDPRSAAALIGRGLVRGNQREFAAAIGDFTEVLRLYPRDPLAYVYRGAVRSMTGDQDGAIADCGKALEIHPDSVGALINRSTARIEKKDYDGALADLARIRAVNPKVPHAWLNEARIHVAKKDFSRAQVALSRTIEADGSYWEGYQLRGLLRQEMQDLDGSIQDLTRAIELTAQRTPVFRAILHTQRCKSRLLRQDLDGGLVDAREALRLQPESAEAQFWHGSALLARGDAEGAIRAYDRTLELDPKYADAWHGRAQAKLLRGAPADVVADATRALEINPDHIAAYLVRALARQRQRDFAGAEADCTKALAVDPATAGAYFVRASCRAALGRFPEAAQDAQKAYDLLPARSPQKEPARRGVEAYRAGKHP